MNIIFFFINYWRLNIFWALREVLKPEPERLGSPHIWRGPADVNVSEKHVWSLLLHKNILSLKNFRQKAFFPLSIMARKGTLPANVLKTPLPGQRLMSSWRHKNTFPTVHASDDDVSFCDSPKRQILIRKTAKLCISSTWIALLMDLCRLKHGC